MPQVQEENNHMIQVKRIETLEDIEKLVFEHERNEIHGRVRDYYVYRGMTDASYDLSTSLQRNCGDLSEQLEFHLLENFVKYASIEDPSINESIWNAMIVGQHHGLPTRLLDWTFSALVALHFATAEDSFADLDKRDCVIWKADVKELNSKLPEKYMSSLRERNTYVFTLKYLSQITNSIREYDEDMGNRSFVTVEPPSIDQRIVNQYSFFMLIPTGIKNLEQYLDDNTERTVKYVIDRRLKWDLRDILDQLNMSERNIYPGLDGISRWLARHYYVKR